MLKKYSYGYAINIELTPQITMETNLEEYSHLLQRRLHHMKITIRTASTGLFFQTSYPIFIIIKTNT